MHGSVILRLEYVIYSTLITSVAMRKKNRRKMANRKGITSLDLLFKKSAHEITWERKVLC